MLSVTKYPAEYVAAARARFASHVQAFDRLGQGDAVAAFEPVFFDNLVLALDNTFTHRARALEGKDGNAMNEVRVLCSSLTEHDGVLTQIKAIKLDPDRSVLGLRDGDRIALTRDDFARLSEAFFEGIEGTFT